MGHTSYQKQDCFKMQFYVNNWNYFYVYSYIKIHIFLKDKNSQSCKGNISTLKTSYLKNARTNIQCRTIRY